MPENRASLEKEVEQLRAEVGTLQQKLKAQDEPPRPPQPIPNPAPPAASPPVPDGRDVTSLPGHQQFSRAVAAAQEAWNHFVELVIGLKNDVLRKS